MRKNVYLIVFFVVIFSKLNSQVNRCVIKVGGKYGFIDTLGNVVIEPQFENAYQFSEGLACAKKDGKFGYVDTTGNFVIPAMFKGSDHFKGGFAKVWIDNGKEVKVGVIDQKGKWVLKPKYDIVTHQNDGFVGAVREGKMAFFDLKKKKFITKFEFDHNECWSFAEGLAMVKIKNHYGFVNSQGEVAIKAIYRQVRDMQFSNGLASVRDEKSGKWGYINQLGEQVIDFRYDEAYRFEENVAWVRDNYGDLWHAIDTNGNTIFDLKVNYAWGYKDGLCGVEINKKYGVIDHFGNWVIQPNYDWIHVYFSDGWICFYNRIGEEVKWGALDDKGNEIVPPLYSRTLRNDGDCGMIELYMGDCDNDINNCSLGYANRKGEIIWEPIK